MPTIKNSRADAWTKKLLAEKKLEEKYKLNIEKGIKYLDKKFGRKVWVKKIDLKKLDLSAPGVCVIGQSFKDYFSEVSGSRDDSVSSTYNSKYGFDVLPDQTADYDLLTYLWFNKIAILKSRIK